MTIDQVVTQGVIIEEEGVKTAEYGAERAQLKNKYADAKFYLKLGDEDGESGLPLLAVPEKAFANFKEEGKQKRNKLIVASLVLKPSLGG